MIAILVSFTNYDVRIVFIFIIISLKNSYFKKSHQVSLHNKLLSVDFVENCSIPKINNLMNCSDSGDL